MSIGYWNGRKVEITPSPDGRYKVAKTEFAGQTVTKLYDRSISDSDIYWKLDAWLYQSGVMD